MTEVADADADGSATVDPATKSKAKLPEGVYRFGGTVTFEDGSTLTVSKPVKFKRDQYAAGGEKFKQSVRVKIRFTNKSDEVFDPVLTTTSISSGETEGEPIYQNGLDAPSNKLLPGRSVTWPAGFRRSGREKGEASSQRRVP